METSKKATPAEVKQAVANYFKEKKITMADAGVQMGLGRAAVSYALSVEDKYFRMAQALKYSAAFGMSIEFLTKGEGELIPPLGKDYSKVKNAFDKVTFGDLGSDEWQELALQHEERRFSQARSDLADLQTIMKTLEDSLKSYRAVCIKLEKLGASMKDFEEKMMLFRRTISDLEKAQAYTIGKLSSVRRIISDIEEQRVRRQNPELWEKADDKRSEEGVESTAARLLKSYLGSDDDMQMDLESDEEK